MVGPMADDQELSTVLNAVTYLRSAVAEMRRMAADEPDLADRLEDLIERGMAEIEQLTDRFRLPH